jgi:hypothetical protein
MIVILEGCPERTEARAKRINDGVRDRVPGTSISVVIDQ